MYKNQTFNNKKCLMCKEDYTPNSSVQKYCEECSIKRKIEYKKQWAKDNREKLTKNSKKWYWENLELARASKRKWNWSESGVKYRKKYSKDHKEVIYERLKKYKDRTNARSRANYKIKKLGWERICKECGSIDKVQIHHIDENPFNNEIENLTLLCLKHHKLKHHHKIQE